MAREQPMAMRLQMTIRCPQAREITLTESSRQKGANSARDWGSPPTDVWRRLRCSVVGHVPVKTSLGRRRAYGDAMV